MNEDRARHLEAIQDLLELASNRELELLGRIHTFEEFLENFALARKMGFENLSMRTSGNPINPSERKRMAGQAPAASPIKIEGRPFA